MAMYIFMPVNILYNLFDKNIYKHTLHCVPKVYNVFHENVGFFSKNYIKYKKV